MMLSLGEGGGRVWENSVLSFLLCAIFVTSWVFKYFKKKKKRTAYTWSSQQDTDSLYKNLLQNTNGGKYHSGSELTWELHYNQPQHSSYPQHGARMDSTVDSFSFPGEWRTGIQKLTHLIVKLKGAIPIQHSKASQCRFQLRLAPRGSLPLLCLDLGDRAPPYVSRSGVGHFFVEADVQIVAWLIGDEQADGNSTVSSGLADVDLDLSLEHSEFPQPAAVAHDHGAYRLLDLCGTTAIQFQNPFHAQS